MRFRLRSVPEPATRNAEPAADPGGRGASGRPSAHGRRCARRDRGRPAFGDRRRGRLDDRTGITAARSTRPATVQVYRREVGDQIVIVREVDAPIRVRDRHWGACRTAYRF